MASLAKATTEQLLAELQRRLKCADKPEKKTIFIGACSGTGGACWDWVGGLVGWWGLRVSSLAGVGAGVSGVVLDGPGLDESTDQPMASWPSVSPFPSSSPHSTTHALPLLPQSCPSARQ